MKKKNYFNKFYNMQILIKKRIILICNLFSIVKVFLYYQRKNYNNKFHQSYLKKKLKK